MMSLKQRNTARRYERLLHQLEDADMSHIEISPKMMAAGLLEFVARDCEFETPEHVVARIYRAMVMTRRL